MCCIQNSECHLSALIELNLSARSTLLAECSRWLNGITERVCTGGCSDAGCLAGYRHNYWSSCTSSRVEGFSGQRLRFSCSWRFLLFLNHECFIPSICFECVEADLQTFKASSYRQAGLLQAGEYTTHLTGFKISIRERRRISAKCNLLVSS